MDTNIPETANQYRWATNLIRQLGLNNEEIGILGSTRVRSGDKTLRVLVPIILEDGTTPFRKQASLRISSDVDIEEVSLAVLPLTGSKYSRALSPIRTGIFIARRPFQVDLPVMPSGYYSIALMAKGGLNLVTTEAVILVAGY
jgi:hypothetical protein